MTFKNGTLSESLNGTRVVFLSVAPGAARAFNPSIDGRQLHFQYLNGSFSDEETHSVWNYDGVAVSGPLMGGSMPRFSSVTAFWFPWPPFYTNTEVYKSN